MFLLQARPQLDPHQIIHGTADLRLNDCVEVSLSGKKSEASWPSKSYDAAVELKGRRKRKRIRNILGHPRKSSSRSKRSKRSKRGKRGKRS